MWFQLTERRPTNSTLPIHDKFLALDGCLVAIARVARLKAVRFQSRISIA
jgi:hypothetical protein